MWCYIPCQYLQDSEALGVSRSSEAGQVKKRMQGMNALVVGFREFLNLVGTYNFLIVLNLSGSLRIEKDV